MDNKTVKEILNSLCFAIADTLDAIKYMDIDKEESKTNRDKAERELMKAIDLINGKPLS